MTAASAFLFNLDEMRWVGEVLGNATEEIEVDVYRRLLMDGYTPAFYNKASGLYNNGVQTAQVLPLALDTVPASMVEGIVGDLLDDIVANHK